MLHDSNACGYVSCSFILFIMTSSSHLMSIPAVSILYISIAWSFGSLDLPFFKYLKTDPKSFNVQGSDLLFLASSSLSLNRFLFVCLETFKTRLYCSVFQHLFVMVNCVFFKILCRCYSVAIWIQHDSWRIFFKQTQFISLFPQFANIKTILITFYVCKLIIYIFKITLSTFFCQFIFNRFQEFFAFNVQFGLKLSFKLFIYFVIVISFLDPYLLKALMNDSIKSFHEFICQSIHIQIFAQSLVRVCVPQVFWAVRYLDKLPWRAVIHCKYII